MKVFFIFFLLSASFLGISQEICDNGIDDDGDGSIDLQDGDCQCFGLNAQLSNAIPNPNFDISSCCPTSWWNNLNCLSSWVTDVTTYWSNSSSQSLNYHNSCNLCNNAPSTSWISPAECSNGNNNGFLNMHFNTFTQAANEIIYAGTCLNTPFYPGNNYQLFFSAFKQNSYLGSSGTTTAHISLYGSTSCNSITSAILNCNNPDWNQLDSIGIAVPNDTNWYQYSFNFSPTDTIYAIALGQSCGANNSGYSRLYIDNLLLYENKHTITISEFGNSCSTPHTLTATIDTTGGSWQWYKDSIAIIGETDSIIDISSMGAGNFTATYNMNGTCQGLNFEVIPLDMPMVFQTAVPSPICEGDNISFDGFSFVSAGTIDHFYYDFGNGDSAFVEDPNYVFDTAGVFNVIFTAETNLGCTTSVSQIVTISPKPEVNFLTGNQCLYDAANFVSLTTLDNGVLDSLSWDFDDGSIEYDSLESHLYNAAGNYTIKLFARSDQGCIDSALQTIVINPVPVADYTVDDDCENINIPFTNTSTISSGTIVNNEWKFGDNATASTVNANHIYLDHGNLMTSLLVTSDSGCVDSTTIAIQVYPEPIAHFTNQSSCFFAEFENTSTIVSGSSIPTTNWNFGDGNTNTEYDTEHFYTANGDYNVTLEVISNNGCIHQFDSTISIFNNLVADFSLPSNTSCSGELVSFINTSTGAPNQIIDYFWETSDGQSSTLENPEFNFENTTDTTYFIDISLIISTGTGCVDTLFQTGAVSILTTPAANFSFSPTQLSISNSEVQFTNLSVRADSYDWNFGDNIFSSELSPSHIYSDVAKSYTVILTAYDKDKTCFDQERKIITIQDEVLFFIPNTFTPDGSGINDQFTPHFISGVDIYNFRLQIFNRWGEIVFESKDPAVGWDGNYAGDLVKGDVYLWKIDFEETVFDKVHTHTGTVTVLR